LRAGASTAVLGGAALAGGLDSPGQKSMVGKLLRRPRARDEMLFLVQRVANGFSLPLYQEAQRRGYQMFLEWQLHPEHIPDSKCDSRIGAYPSIKMSYEQLWATFGPDNVGVVAEQLKEVTLLRGVFSNRHLLERMVEFWSDHFSMYHDKAEVGLLKTVDDRDVIRKHALGNFPDMLRASAHGGAMLVYLDNWTNTRGTPQENYARELLELHTLGVDGGYTEKDVKEVARCLTGWTIEQEPAHGEFIFRDVDHDQEAKVVLGHLITKYGKIHDGEKVLDLVAKHPSTAHFLSRKMCRWLISYNPPQDLVNEVADVYLATGGDIKEMLRKILAPASVTAANRFEDLKLRRPFHFALSLMQSCFFKCLDPAALVGEVRAMGQFPFDRITPDGFPDSLDAWGSAMLPRWSFSTKLLSESISGALVNHSKLDPYLDVPDGELAQAIDRLLTGGTMAPEDVADVQSFIDSFHTVSFPVKAEAIALAASCSSYQFY
jgi:hypothetical protein